MKDKSLLTDRVFLMAIIAIAVLVRLWKYTPVFLTWDQSVYLQMGKYLFSNGHIGLMAPLRPLSWPLLLGGCFKLGFDPVICGKILVFLCTIGSIILIYRIGLKVFDNTTGLIAALFLGFSPAYFYYGNSLYADIPASFFGLLSVLLFIEERYLLSGILISLTFFTKFFYLIAMAIMIGFSFNASSKNNPTKSNSPSMFFITGIILSTIFFFSLNFGLYHNIFQPFIDSQQCYTQLDFNWGRGVIISLLRLFTIESTFFIFTPLMILALFQRKDSPLRIMITALGIGLFLWIGKWPTDIPRYLTACVPCLYLSSAYGFLIAYRSSLNLSIKYFLIGVLVVCLGWQIYQTNKIHFPRNRLSIFQKYMIKHSADIKDGLWISDPSTTVYSDLKVQELMYYPVFNIKKIIDLTNNLPKANYIFYNGKALICRPTFDRACEEAKDNLLKEIMNKFELVFPDDISLFDNYGIFKRPANADPSLKEK